MPTRRTIPLYALLFVPVGVKPSTAELDNLETGLAAIHTGYETKTAPAIIDACDGLITRITAININALTSVNRKRRHRLTGRTLALRADAAYNAADNPHQVAAAIHTATTAGRLADLAADPTTVAYTQRLRASIALGEGHPDQALTLARHALNSAPTGSPASITAGVTIARALAVLGAPAGAISHALDDAITAAHDLPADQHTTIGAEHPDATDPLEIMYGALIAHARTGNTARIADLEGAHQKLTTRAPSFSAVLHAHLARMHATTGDPETAAHHITQTLNLAPRPFRSAARPLHATLIAAGKHNIGNAQAIADATEAITRWTGAASA